MHRRPCEAGSNVGRVELRWRHSQHAGKHRHKRAHDRGEAGKPGTTVPTAGTASDNASRKTAINAKCGCDPTSTPEHVTRSAIDMRVPHPCFENADAQ